MLIKCDVCGNECRTFKGVIGALGKHLDEYIIGDKCEDCEKNNRFLSEVSLKKLIKNKF